MQSKSLDLIPLDYTMQVSFLWPTSNLSAVHYKGKWFPDDSLSVKMPTNRNLYSQLYLLKIEEWQSSEDPGSTDSSAENLNFQERWHD